MTLPTNPFKSSDTAPKSERPDAILVIKFLGTFALAGLTFSFLLSWFTPTSNGTGPIVTLTTGAVTGLAAILASTKIAPTGTTDNPIAVEGTTKPDATPVNTTEEPMQ